MSKKFPKPFFVTARGVWRVQIGRQQYKLGSDESEAWKKYHELMARPPEVASDFVAGVIEGYLDWCQRRVDRQELEPRTYAWYKQHLQSFVNWLPARNTLTVDQLKPFHIQDWVDSKQTWGACHRRGAIIAVQRVFSWAEKQGHILKSPIRNVEKPAPKRREQFLTRVEFEAVLAVVKDSSFRDVLEFCWETGCRVQEVRVITAAHFIAERGRVQLPPTLFVKAGIPADRITTEGLGSDKPIAPNDTDENRVKNRRIELTIEKK